jgi:hypothetical protein
MRVEAVVVVAFVVVVVVAFEVVVLPVVVDEVGPAGPKAVALVVS